MIAQKKTNPLHHNAGRLPNFNQSLSQHLSFANMTLKGFSGNLGQCINLIQHDHRSEHWDGLPAGERNKLIEYMWKLKNLAAEASDLAADIAEYNRDKTKLVLPKMPKAAHRHLVIKDHLTNPKGRG